MGFKLAELDEVTDGDFATRVLGSERPVLVEFGADWCGPCRQLGPVLAAIATEEKDLLGVVQLDIDHNQETTIRYGILSAPTLMVFRGGEPVMQVVGARSKAKLLTEIGEALAAA